MLSKPHATALVALALFGVAVPVTGQDGPLRKAGRALDNAGKSIRRDIEDTVARGQITALQRDLLGRVTSRIQWDKRLIGSSITLEVAADGSAVLRGSVPDASAKDRAVDLVESTVGITRLVDELAVSTGVRVIEAKPIEPTPARVVITPEAAPTVVIETPADPKPIRP